MRNLLDKGTKCLIVQPKFPDHSLCNYDDVCAIAGARYIAPPLGLLTVAALLPGQWTLKLVDENVEPLRDEHFTWANIVVTGGWLPQQLRIRSIIARSHSHGRPIAVGGPGPTAQPIYINLRIIWFAARVKSRCRCFCRIWQRGLPAAFT